MLIGAHDLCAVELDDRARAELELQARHEVAIDVAGAPCAVRFADPAAAALFARKYADLATNAVPLLTAIVGDVPRLGPVFAAGPRAFRWPHGELDASVVAFLADAVALTVFFDVHPHGAVSLHAAAVGDGDGVAAIVGDSTAGKTTTALACARRGLTPFTDERCAIAGGLVHAFPRAVSVRAGGRALLLADDADDDFARRLRAADDASEMRYGELLPQWSLPSPAPLRCVFVLAGVDARPALEPVAGAVAARAAARWAHGAGRGLERVARLVALFAGVACYRLTLGTPSATAATIAAALHRQAERRCSA